jgi:hypothetical protein
MLLRFSLNDCVSQPPKPHCSGLTHGTVEQVRDNLDAIYRAESGIQYVRIDA